MYPLYFAHTCNHFGPMFNLLCCLLDLKSMVSAGLASLASSSYDLAGAVAGRRALNVLCLGHGGGNLPLFVASKIKGKE